MKVLAMTFLSWSWDEWLSSCSMSLLFIIHAFSAILSWSFTFASDPLRKFSVFGKSLRMLSQQTGFFTQIFQFTTTTFPNIILKPHFLRNTTVLYEPKERLKWYTGYHLCVETLNDGVDAKMAIKGCPVNVHGCSCVCVCDGRGWWGGVGSLELALPQRHRIEILVLIVVDVNTQDSKHLAREWVLVGQILILLLNPMFTILIYKVEKS